MMLAQARRYFFPLTLVGLLLPSPASANVIGSDHQNFNTANGEHDMITVFSARAMKAGRAHFGLGVNYSENTLPYFSEEEAGASRANAERSDSLTALDLVASIGITDFWSLGVSLPYLVEQRLNNEEGYRGQFNRLGNTEIRYNSKLTWYESDSFASALLLTGNYNRVANNPYTGDIEWPVFAAEVLFDFNVSDFSILLNLGHRWRQAGEFVPLEGEVAIEPFKDQWIYSLATALKLPIVSTTWINEVYGSYYEEDNIKTSLRNPSVIEAISALRFRFEKQGLSLDFGLGSELRHAVSTPDIRVFSGISWNVGIFSQAVRGPTLNQAPVSLSSSSQSSAQADVKLVLEDIQFAFDSAEISGQPSRKNLDKLGSILLSDRPLDYVVVSGHACAIGSEVYNLELSERRALAIVEWLVENYKIPRERIIPVGFGIQQPAMSNLQEAGRTRNRRVEFEVYYAGESAFAESLKRTQGPMSTH